MSVEDEGRGVPEPQLAELNTRLAEPQAGTEAEALRASSGWGLGMYVVGRLSARHGIRVELRGREAGGTVAEVTVPRALLPGSGDGAGQPLEAEDHARTADEHPQAGATGAGGSRTGASGTGAPGARASGAGAAGPEARQAEPRGPPHPSGPAAASAEGDAARVGCPASARRRHR